MKRIVSSCFGVALAVTVCAAEFEGTVKMKMSLEGGAQGQGVMTMEIGKTGARNKMEMNAGGMQMNRDMLMKVVSRISCMCWTTRPTYSVMDLGRMREMAKQTPGSAAAERVSVKKLGKEKILDYDTQHVIITRGDDKETTEMWTSKDVMDYETFSKLQSRSGKRDPGDQAVEKALKDAGADGMPLKLINTSPEGMKVTMEVTSMDETAARQHVSDSFRLQRDGGARPDGRPGAGVSSQQLEITKSRWTKR